MQKKIFKIRIGNTTNKGDMMMLLAIMDKFDSCYFCIEPGRVSRVLAKKLGLKFAVPLRQVFKNTNRFSSTLKRILATLIDFFPAILLASFRLVPNRQIAGVIDASGYAYGDNWGTGKIQVSTFENKFFKNNNKPIVLLPQSFGPFQNEVVANEFRDMIYYTDIVYARDNFSYEFLSQVLPNYRHFKLAPDFTFDVKGFIPPDMKLPAKYVCIVPNHRMLEVSEQQTADAYIPFLITCIETAEIEGFEVIFVHHDTKHDAHVSQLLIEKLGREFQIISHYDVRVLKAVIGGSTLTVSSRYHGLINALYQGVPVIATKWTHKFPSIMEKYGCEKYLLEPSSTSRLVKESVSELLVGHSRTQVIKSIIETREAERKISEIMWGDVRAILHP